MKSLPRISIITPSFNQGQYIEQTILSILDQHYPNLEYIIIDGGSTDNTVEIIKKYEKHLAYWVSEPDRGQSHAINKGLEKATGAIFNWINSDDYLEPGALAAIGQEFSKHPTAKLLYGYCTIFDDLGIEPSYLLKTKMYESIEQTLIQEQINQPGMFYHLPSIKELKGVNESLNYVMDLELWFRFMAKFGIQECIETKKTLANFRYHSQSKTMAFSEIFREEAHQVFHHLFSELKLPIAITQAFQSSKHNYQPSNWDLSNINAKELLAQIANNYLFDFYKQNKTAAAKIAYIQQLKNANIIINKAYMSLFYRLYVSHKEYGK